MKTVADLEGTEPAPPRPI